MEEDEPLEEVPPPSGSEAPPSRSSRPPPLASSSSLAAALAPSSQASGVYREATLPEASALVAAISTRTSTWNRGFNFFRFRVFFFPSSSRG